MLNKLFSFRLTFFKIIQWVSAATQKRLNKLKSSVLSLPPSLKRPKDHLWFSFQFVRCSTGKKSCNFCPNPSQFPLNCFCSENSGSVFLRFFLASIKLTKVERKEPKTVPSSYRPNFSSTFLRTEVNFPTRPLFILTSVFSIKTSILVWYLCCN